MIYPTQIKDENVLFISDAVAARPSSEIRVQNFRVEMNEYMTV